MMRRTLLSTTYFGPIEWYSCLYRSPEVLIERCEHFQKQSYRNRCTIATASGPQSLTVPVERDGNQLISDIRISDHGQWRRHHWHALVTAYGDSPFFEYYQDDLHPFFERQWTYLIDFNEAIRQTLCQLLDIEPCVGFTTAYQTSPPDSADFRSAIHPKHPQPDAIAPCRPYYQVFAARHGFLPQLSILDLLFNMGPESIFFL